MATSNNWQVYRQYLNETPDNAVDFRIRQQKPKYPQYAVESKRLESFKTWSDAHPVKPEVLVEAGLVFTGVGDNVRCYYCGCELRNWGRDDNPWEEHARVYSDCPHVLLEKRQQYVDRVKRGEKPDEDGSKSVVVEAPSSQMDLINTPAAQACLQMGYNTDKVQAAIDKYFQKSGSSNFKAKDIAAILEDINEEQRPSEGAAPVSEIKENRGDNDNESPIHLQTISIEMKPTDELVCLPCGHRVQQFTRTMSQCPVCKTKLSGATVPKHE